MSVLIPSIVNDVTRSHILGRLSTKDLIRLSRVSLTWSIETVRSITVLMAIDAKHFTDASVKHLVNLTSLNLYDNRTITDASLKLLTNLTSLNLRGNDTITDASVSLLTNLIK